LLFSFVFIFLFEILPKRNEILKKSWDVEYSVRRNFQKQETTEMSTHRETLDFSMKNGRISRKKIKKIKKKGIRCLICIRTATAEAHSDRKFPKKWGETMEEKK